MPLTGSYLERTQKAIVATFSRDDLLRFLRFELDENFEAIVRDDNLTVQAYEVLLWAGRHGREQEMLDKLLAERPTELEFAVVAEALRSGEPLVPPGSLYTNLPTYGRVPLQKPLRVQHFTGRELELARLLAYLEPGKILTLCGPGGMGKTALAAEAIWRLAPADDPPDRFPDGVIFHTFYHQPQADAALEAIARFYGADPRSSPRDAARLALTGRRALLVLDGAEAANDLDTLLSVVGNCGVLITTRRQSDAPSDVQAVEPLPQADSLGLLRAWAGRYAGEDAVANDIVRLLGGLPLALYLCGRYLMHRRQGAGEYIAWLQEEGLEALHFGERPSKSIPLLLRRSLEQVSQRAQAAFGVVGILALAPFEAAVVAAALDIESSAANRALGELVDYGLLLRPDDSYQVTHALAHSYARAQAVPSVDVVNRLAMRFASIAKTESARGLAGYAVLDHQRAHIVAVQAAALKAELWHGVRQITWNAREHLVVCGYWAERVAVIQAGLVAARVAGSSYDEMAFLNDLGLASVTLGETRRAIELYEQALVIAREVGDRRGEAAALGNLGLAYASLGETRRAIELYEQALVIARDAGDRRVEAAALGNLGNAYADLGELRRAIELYGQQLVTARDIGHRRREGSALGGLGTVYAALGETRRAIELYEQALVIAREVGDRPKEGAELSNLGTAYASLGEIRRAIELYEQALVIARDVGDRHGEAAALVNLGLAHTALGETRRAIELYEHALAIVREIGDRRVEGAALGNLGIAYAALGETRRAIELYEEQLVIVREIGDRLGEGNALVTLGVAYKNLGETRRAVKLYEQALAILREIGDRRGEGAALGNMGVAYTALGKPRRAIKLHQKQLVIAREIGDRRGEGSGLSSLGSAYMGLSNTHRAIELFEQQLVIVREIGDRSGEGAALANLGFAYVALRAPQRALELFEQSLITIRKTGDRSSQLAALRGMANAYIALKEFHRAVELYEQLLVVAREIGNRREEANTSWEIGLVYQAVGAFDRAATNMQVFVDYEHEIGHPDAASHAQQLADVRAHIGL